MSQNKSTTLIGFWLPIILALISSFTALYQSFSSKENSKSAVETADTVKDELRSKDKITLYREFPVGTIVSSVLDYQKFSKLLEQPSPSKYSPTNVNIIWVPADGRNCLGSKFADVAETSVVPDYRGLFLRGENAFDISFEPRPVLAEQRDNGLRAKGGLQLDEVKRHTHNYFAGTKEHTERQTGNSKYLINPGWKESTAFGTDETRPKNRAVKYYIKIN